MNSSEAMTEDHPKTAQEEDDDDVLARENPECAKDDEKDEAATSATDGKSSTASVSDEPHDEVEAIPQAKYKVLDKVFARDNDGVLYESVVRRCLYGAATHQQVHVGMTNSAEEASDLVKQSENSQEPAWHYFVHFNKWNANWDRWTAEENILPITPQTRNYVELVRQEHAALRKALTKKLAGKKASQCLNAVQFLREWRKKLHQLNTESSRFQGESGSEATTPSKSPSTRKKQNKPRKAGDLSKAELEKEVHLRHKGLTKKRTADEASTIALPFTLKKVLVEQWEVISCGMVLSVPATVSVRQALNLYLTSKGVKVPVTPAKESKKDIEAPPRGEGGSLQTPAAKMETPAEKVSSKSFSATDQGTVVAPTGAGRIEGESNVSQPKTEDDKMDVSPWNERKDPVKANAIATPNKSKEDEVGKSNNPPATMEQSISATSAAPATGDSETKEAANTNIKDTKAPDDVPTPSKNKSLQEQRDQEWIDMAEGIALLFDEALPGRLLYEEELSQVAVLDSIPDLSDKRYSDLYGCEHLLRLFVRLAPLLVESMPEEEERRPILGKVNDFIRFVHKNQAALLAQTYRKTNAKEIEEKQKRQKKTAASRKRRKIAKAKDEED